MTHPDPELKHKALWLIIGYLLVALIVYLSLTSTPPDIGPKLPFKDKLFHAFAYFTVMIWFAQIYHNKVKRNLWALFLILVGITLEYLQSFDPAREGGVSDALANTAGVLIGLALALTAFRNMLLKLEKLL